MANGNLQMEGSMSLELCDDQLNFDFTHLHPDATLKIVFHRTLRVPDNGETNFLPPSLGRFPVMAVDELSQQDIPTAWKRRGGVAFPMWQGEACWLSFQSPRDYPFLVKVAAGKINAINGGSWTNEPDFSTQDFVEVPTQPWLDGFNVGDGTVLQFVSMPLGQGYTAEEQLTGESRNGGIQLLVHPLKPGIWRKRMIDSIVPLDSCIESLLADDCSSGLAPGGKIRQEISAAVEKPSSWDLSSRSRCYVHLVQAEAWESMAGQEPHHKAPTAADYTAAGLPWFDWSSAASQRKGATRLGSLASVKTLGDDAHEDPLGHEEAFETPEPVVLGGRQRRAFGTTPDDRW
jgi:hypothetical protein